MLSLILYSLIGGAFSLIGGLLLLTRADLAKRVITPLLAFSAGAFLAASLLDILPEALEVTIEPHYVLASALAGFLIFFVLERLLMFLHARVHEHKHSDHTESLSFLLVLGDSIHNFIDGIVIALAYLASPVLGLTTTLGVAAHEVPQEIGDFSILLNQGWSKWRIIWVNVLQSLLTIPGVLIGYYAGQWLEPQLPYLLGGTAGIFLYIAASDLIPEIHHRSGHRQFWSVVLPLLASVLLMAYLINLAHQG
jgi:zinc and cadmium transporter